MTDAERDAADAANEKYVREHYETRSYLLGRNHFESLVRILDRLRARQAVAARLSAVVVAELKAEHAGMTHWHPLPDPPPGYRP